LDIAPETIPRKLCDPLPLIRFNVVNNMGGVKEKQLRALSINTPRPVRTVKLVNGTQNVWASDISDRKI
jgi:hypothetical protein